MKMHIDEVVGHVIQLWWREQNPGKNLMSRQKLPCTRCRTVVSTTWRPGPCGTSSLCNTCGVQYMRRQGRPRMIDLVKDGTRPIWVERDATSFQWKETREADLKDKRVKDWTNHETERLEYITSKKRKFVHL